MDAGSVIHFVAALAFVLGLIFGLAWAVKRFNLVPWISARPEPAQKQLAVQESLMLDPRHRLVLFRRGNTGHLLLLGPPSPIVIETGIPLDPPAEIIPESLSS